MKILSYVFCFTCFLFSCKEKPTSYRIYGSVEEPQASFIRTFAETINTYTEDSLRILPLPESNNVKEDLAAGKVDFAILDNFSEPSAELSAVLPLYPKILHLLIKKELETEPLSQLLWGKKVFAGEQSSSSYKLIKKIMEVYQIPDSKVQFLSYLEIFNADIIVSFTDLLTIQELRDLNAYKLYSLGSDDITRGSAAKGIAIHFPQIEPYIIPADTYGSFTPEPVVTLRDLAILTVRKDMDHEKIYNWMKLIREHKQEFSSINPLISEFSNDFDPDKINQVLHKGSLNYLNRYEPTFLERYAEVLSVLISVMVALISGIYTFTQWQRTKKKNKIDIYYTRLIKLREKIPSIEGSLKIARCQIEIRKIQTETFDLLIREKLLADESFTILLNLTKLVQTELNDRKRVVENKISSTPKGIL